MIVRFGRLAGLPATSALATLVTACATLVTACATVRTTGSIDAVAMDRAQLARCAHAGVATSYSSEDIAELAGSYTLHLFGEDGEDAVSADLELWGRSSTETDPSPLAGPPPVLAGATDLAADRLGLVIPGDARSRESESPGVGVYWFENDAPRLRLGSEANRRDRTRFDGAHATLTVLTIDDAGFGGTWSSSVDTAAANGEFCARRHAG